MLARSVLLIVFFTSSLAFASSQVDLAKFDSVWRVPLPEGHIISVVEHSRSGARQVFEIVPALSTVQSSQLTEAFAKNTQVLSVHAEGGKFDIRFHEPRAFITPFGAEIWALVVHRPKALPLAELMAPEECESWFPHVGETLREHIRQLCAGSNVAIRIESSRESHDDVFVRRLLRGYLQGKPELHLADHWLRAHPSISPASRELVQILRVVELVRSGDSVQALEALEVMLRSLYGQREEAALSLGRGVYGLALVQQIFKKRDLGIVLLYPLFARWGGRECIPKETWKRLAFLLDEIGETEYSIDALMSFIEFHGEEQDVLFAVHRFFLKVGKPYHAHLIARRM